MILVKMMLCVVSFFWRVVNKSRTADANIEIKLLGNEIIIIKIKIIIRIVLELEN